MTIYLTLDVYVSKFNSSISVLLLTSIPHPTPCAACHHRNSSHSLSQNSTGLFPTLSKYLINPPVFAQKAGSALWGLISWVASGGQDTIGLVLRTWKKFEYSPRSCLGPCSRQQTPAEISITTSRVPMEGASTPLIKMIETCSGAFTWRRSSQQIAKGCGHLVPPGLALLRM